MATSGNQKPLPNLETLKGLNARRKELYCAGDILEAHKLETELRLQGRLLAELTLKGQAIDRQNDFQLAKILKGITEHGPARRLLARLRAQDPNDLKVAQELALNTYKDEALPPDDRFAKALAILEEIGLREDDCKIPETLGQGGAIYKRRWERTGQIDDLYTALHFYRKGWQNDPLQDIGYCGGNAAFILDLLANRLETMAAREKIPPTGVEDLKNEARQLREDMKRQLPGLAKERAKVSDKDQPAEEYWYRVTMAEICFGLEDWEGAEEWLALARKKPHDEWERQTTAKQLVTIARMRGFRAPKDYEADESWASPWKALRALLGDDTRAAIGSHRGKVGLALSGGGFRAALFHLGVLARLAECDALRSIEVLSTVSGGSIVGAHYYLALRHRLQSKVDGELNREAYIKLVKEVIEQFCAGVQQNLRTRSFASLSANLRMTLFPSYGRSNRIGELYDEFLFSQVNDGHKKHHGLRKLRDLIIHPRVIQGEGEPESNDRDQNFKPKFSNWRRQAKVPILLLNSTSLNSGHNWQFTATWMGEPPGLTGQEIDMNERYRRFYYGEAPTKRLQDYPLAYAVAASAGVPALFDPLVLKGVYPGRTIKLVDGGVHDNQGVAGLLDEGCTLILCSDASGQMDDQESPATNELNVFYRSDSILQDRLREAQYQDLDSRNKSHALQGLFFIHLKQGLQTDPIDWVNCGEPRPATSRSSCTEYGVNRQIQKLLAEMRTDLDTFTDVEAQALMASGYLMTDHQLRTLAQEEGGNTWKGWNVEAQRENNWPFETMLSLVRADPDESDRRATDIAKQLKISAILLGKVWYADKGARTWTIALVALLMAWAGHGLLNRWRDVIQFDYKVEVYQIVLAVATLLFGTVLPLAKFVKPVDIARRWLVMLGVTTAGWLGTNFYLYVLDPRYKKRGSLARLLNLPADH